MLKRSLMCLFLLLPALPAWATDYTDVWYIPAESGWGANIIQSDAFMFVTYFIYGPDKKPIWYTAQLTLDASNNYIGKLYATTGSFYGAPWVPGDQTTTEVGTASFQPTGPYTATFVYTVTTPASLAATVTKAIQRQPLTQITIGGTYVGAQSGAYSGGSCNKAGSYSDYYSLSVTQNANRTVSMVFSYNSGLSCTLAGTLTQFGKLYLIPTTSYKCSDGVDTSASMGELTATNLGIEGRFSAPIVGGNCREDATFSGVLH
ncbi:MAG: hypothetical protein ABI537_13505 [Casimicrobiaceae bacterium]